MNEPNLVHIARSLFIDGKGLLAMGESTNACNTRFAAQGIAQTIESRRAYREMLITTPGLGEHIGGAILCDETIRQHTATGIAFTKLLEDGGIVTGIKVDTGTTHLAGQPGERITEGLDRLRSRLAEYAAMGARFAKWRAVIRIGDGLPRLGCIEANAHALARYAALCQEVGLVPIVEPEVLVEGDHSLERCYEVTERVLHIVFDQLYRQCVQLEGMLLKPNMVLTGSSCPDQAELDEVADATLKCFMRTVPAAVPGIAFLSGGQSAELASARLNAMNLQASKRLPWVLTFSYGRAIQQPVLETWARHNFDVKAAQQALLHQAECNRAACKGEYHSTKESKYHKSCP